MYVSTSSFKILTCHGSNDFNFEYFITNVPNCKNNLVQNSDTRGNFKTFGTMSHPTKSQTQGFANTAAAGACKNNNFTCSIGS